METINVLRLASEPKETIQQMSIEDIRKVFETLEEINYHTENAVILAKFFNLPDSQIRILEGHLNKILHEGGITVRDQMEQYSIVKHLYPTLKERNTP